MVPFSYSIRHRKPSTAPLAPQQPADLPPDEPPAPGPEAPRPGAWRAVHQRGGFRRARKRSEARPAGPIIETPMQMQPPPGPPPDRAQAPGSWATWQGKCHFFLVTSGIYKGLTGANNSVPWHNVGMQSPRWGIEVPWDIKMPAPFLRTALYAWLCPKKK